jgi:hypothetical protein
MYRCVLLISVIVYQLHHICVSFVIQLSTFRVVGVVIRTQVCYTNFILVYAYFELHNIYYIRRNWGHSFGVVTKLRPGWLGILVQFPTAVWDLSVLLDVRPVSEAHPRVQEAVSPGNEGAERTNVWSYIIAPAYTLMLRFFIEHRAKICPLFFLRSWSISWLFSVHTNTLVVSRVKQRPHATTYVPSHCSLIIRNYLVFSR